MSDKLLSLLHEFKRKGLKFSTNMASIELCSTKPSAQYAPNVHLPFIADILVLSRI